MARKNVAGAEVAAAAAEDLSPLPIKRHWRLPSPSPKKQVSLYEVLDPGVVVLLGVRVQSPGRSRTNQVAHLPHPRGEAAAPLAGEARQALEEGNQRQWWNWHRAPTWHPRPRDPAQ